MIKYCLNRTVGRIRKFLFSRGSVIAVMGVDGSGKTTLIQALLNFFNYSGGSNCAQSIYLGSLGGYILPFNLLHKYYSKIFTTSKPPAEAMSTPAKEENAPHTSPNLIKDTLFGVFLICEYITRSMLFFWQSYICKKTIIFDRYFFDSYRSFVDHPIVHFMSYIFPKPDELLYLNGDAQLFFLRKGEYSVEILREHQSSVINVLEKEYKGRLIILDAAKSETEVTMEAISKICDSP